MATKGVFVSSIAVAIQLLFSLSLRAVGYASKIYVSPLAASPSDGTEGTPTTLLDGVARARSAGDTEVLLTPGTYDLEEEVVLDSSILLRGVEGADRTILRRVNRKTDSGELLIQRVLRIDHPLARAEGVTLTGGSSWYSGNSLPLEAMGGGVLIGASGGTLSSSIVSNNTAGRVMNGAGVAMIGEASVVTNCIIIGNAMQSRSGWIGHGAGAYMKAGLLTHSALIANTNNMESHSFGGGAYVEKGTVSHCKFLRNVTPSGRGLGSGLYIKDEALVENCLFAENWTVGNGGVYASKGILQNCTIANNESSDGTGGLYAGKNASVRNCIIDGNLSFAVNRELVGNCWIEPGAIVERCLSSTPFPEGDTNNIVGRALLRNPASGDYSPGPLSPAIDAGCTNGFTGWTSKTDLAGNARLVNSEPDIGAYEYQANQLDAVLLAPERALPGESLHFEVRAFTPVPGRELHYRWDASDGSASEGQDGPVFEHAFSEVGTKTVSVTVDDGNSELTKTREIYIAPKDLYVVAIPEPGQVPVPPYDSPHKAATNILEALRLAADGSIVHLGPGHYGTTYEIIVDKGVTLVGTEGAAETEIYRTDTKTKSHDLSQMPQRVMRIDHPDAVVKGVTISKGWIYGSTPAGNYIDGIAGAGVLICRRGGTLDSCLVTNNQAHSLIYSAGAALTSRDGVITNCTIAGNKCTGWNNYGGGLYLKAGTLSHSFFHSNTNGAEHNHHGGAVYAVDGRISKCRFVGNYTTGTGGGLYSQGNVIVKNCLFADNRANVSSGGIMLKKGHLIHCTIARNLGIQKAGGVCSDSNASCILDGCIIDENHVQGAITAGTEDWVIGDDAFANGCLSPAPFTCKGDGNIVGHAHFRDPDKGDYYLSGFSDAIDQAPREFYENMAEDTDLGGNCRVFGKAPDIGAFEYQADALDVIFEVPEPSLIGTEVLFTASAFSPNTEATISYRWDFGDGSAKTDWSQTPDVPHTFTQYGRHNVTLEVTDGTLAKTITQPFFTGVPEIFVLNELLNPDHTPQEPYGTLATAALTIGDALEWAVDGTIIHVGPGIYKITDEIIIQHGIRLIATDDAAHTEIRRVGADIKGSSGVTILQRVLRINHPDAKVEGFTISGGWIYGSPLNNAHSGDLAGAGVLIGARGGTLCSCIVTNNRSRWVVQGGGVGVLNGGLVTNCIIRNNLVNGWVCRGGGAFVDRGGRLTHSIIIENLFGRENASHGGGVYLNGGHLSHCLVATNRNAVTQGCTTFGGGIEVNGTSSQVDNCLVIGNRCNGTGGGLYAKAGTFVNNTIADNEANLGGGVYGENDSVILRNCIIQGNRTTGDETAGAPEWNGEKALYSYCMSTRPLPGAGDGNLAGDALFDGNGYTLSRESPCHDAGSVEGYPWLATEGATDYAGNLRIDRRTIDIGCFETPYHPPATLLMLR